MKNFYAEICYLRDVLQRSLDNGWFWPDLLRLVIMFGAAVVIMYLIADPFLPELISIVFGQ